MVVVAVLAHAAAAAADTTEVAVLVLLLLPAAIPLFLVYLVLSLLSHLPCRTCLLRTVVSALLEPAATLSGAAGGHTDTTGAVRRTSWHC